MRPQRLDCGAPHRVRLERPRVHHVSIYDVRCPYRVLYPIAVPLLIFIFKYPGIFADRPLVPALPHGTRMFVIGSVVLVTYGILTQLYVSFCVLGSSPVKDQQLQLESEAEITGQRMEELAEAMSLGAEKDEEFDIEVGAGAPSTEVIDADTDEVKVKAL